MGGGGLCLLFEKSVWTVWLHCSNRFNLILICCIFRDLIKRNRGSNLQVICPVKWNRYIQFKKLLIMLSRIAGLVSF